MEVLSSRLILHPVDLIRSRHFYEEQLGLRLFHEYSDQGRLIGVVYFLGGGFLELSGSHTDGASGCSKIWLQVPDVGEEQRRLIAAGVTVDQVAERKPWGLIEMMIRDPDGHELRLTEVPEDHFLRRQL